jgi:hypothetical protein
MRRAIASFRLAFEAIVGVLLLGNAAFKLCQLMAPMQPGPSIGTLIGTVIGAVFVWDAFRLRRQLNRIDTQTEPSADGEEPK